MQPVEAEKISYIVTTRDAHNAVMYRAMTVTSFMWKYSKYSMKQTPQKANTSWASKEIPDILWNPEVHKHAHKGMSLVAFLSQMNPLCLRYILVLSF